MGGGGIGTPSASGSEAWGTLRVNGSMCLPPETWRAASRLWTSQRTLQLSTVDGPPLPRGTT